MQFKVRVENGLLSLIPAAREKEVDGFTESHRLVDTQVIPDPKRRSRFDVILATGKRSNLFFFVFLFLLFFPVKGEHFRFDAGSESSAKQWVNAILTNVQPSNSSFRFDSFARRREGVDVKWYVDGKDYFADLLLVLRAAQEEILITDWSMSPEIFLERELCDPDARLDRCLIERAKAGVKVLRFLILFCFLVLLFFFCLFFSPFLKRFISCCGGNPTWRLKEPSMPTTLLSAFVAWTTFMLFCIRLEHFHQSGRITKSPSLSTERSDSVAE